MQQDINANEMHDWQPSKKIANAIQQNLQIKFPHFNTQNSQSLCATYRDVTNIDDVITQSVLKQTMPKKLIQSNSNWSTRCLVLPDRICFRVLYLSLPALTFSVCNTSSWVTCTLLSRRSVNCFFKSWKRLKKKTLSKTTQMKHGEGVST